MSRIGAFAAALLLSLLLTISGCSRPPAPPPPQESAGGKASGEESPVQAANPAGASVQRVTPRLLLDLALGDDPDQPGTSPSRVGGVSPRGPVAIAVAERATIFLLDQAKGRVLRYNEGNLTLSLATPWVDDQAGDLRLEPGRLVLTSHFKEFTLDVTGRVVAIRTLPYQSDPVIETKAPIPLGEDAAGNRYERVVVSAGPLIRRISAEGAELARAPIPGAVIDWFISRDGGVFALTWQWGPDRIERAQVYEVLPPVSSRAAAESVPPPEEYLPPVLFNRPVPDRIRLLSADWAPVTVTSATDRWNLWRLLATAGPSAAPPPAGMAPLTRLEASFADGSILALDLYPDQITVQGARYTVGAAEALRLAVGALRLSPEALVGAVDAAGRVDLAILDVPGLQRSLSSQEREQVRVSLKELLPVNMYATPQPLEPPFPRYAIRLKGDGWDGEILLQGERHLSLGYGAAAVHDGALQRLAADWLPVPDLRPDQVSYLFLADRLEIGQGNDLTRWKNTVVRRLLRTKVNPNATPALTDPFTLTFHVKGERRTVAVDTVGFTYAGKRYSGSGLTDLPMLQGVP